MPTQPIERQTQFLMTEDVVADLAFHAAAVGAPAGGIGESVLPAEKWELPANRMQSLTLICGLNQDEGAGRR
jgi:hypothetical protein